jgi:hypothetical protein
MVSLGQGFLHEQELGEGLDGSVETVWGGQTLNPSAKLVFQVIEIAGVVDATLFVEGS